MRIGAAGGANIETCPGQACQIGKSIIDERNSRLSSRFV